MVSYKIYEGDSHIYLVGFLSDGQTQTVSMRRTTEPPDHLAGILKFDPQIYHVDIARRCKLVAEAELIVGIIRFLSYYSLVVCTRAEAVASLGSNVVYTITAVQMIPISPPAQESNPFASLFQSLNRQFTQSAVDSAEKKYAGLFQALDLTKDFYYSFSYNLTTTIQANVLRSENKSTLESSFVWNDYLLTEFRTLVPPEHHHIWTVPLIHGFFQQKRFSSFGKMFDVILIARRSRHFAGTRYLKRGVNDDGQVANDCEIEIVLQRDSDMASSGPLLSFASYTQVRGSIPVYWSQETSVTVPKPPILLHKVDPEYRPTRLHFRDLFRRYGKPVVVLDLVKQQEKRRRECIIGREFFNAVEFLNGSLPCDMKIKYCGLDFSRISSTSKDTAGPGESDKYYPDVGIAGVDAFDVAVGCSTAEEMRDNDRRGSTSSDPALNILEELDIVALFALTQTGFFTTKLNRLDSLTCLSSSAVSEASKRGALVQKGVLRSNCVDCLDRTNVAQFAVGVKFVGLGMYSLDLSESSVLASSSPVLKSFVAMFTEMGDRLAMQYGGSEAHKRVADQHGRGNATSGQAVSNQGELLSTIKRYYSNAFTDRMKQDAINLFLGAFIPLESKDVYLWDLESDYYLHNSKQTILKDSQPVTEVNEEGTDNNGALLREIQALDEEELRKHPLIERYRVDPSLNTGAALRLILESEHRKELARLQLYRVHEEGLEDWRQALSESNAITGARLPFKTNIGNGTSPSCDEWTSFDELLALPFNVPRDATVSAAPENDILIESSDEVDQHQHQPSSSKAVEVVTNPSEEETLDANIISVSRQVSDDVGALIGQYVRGISFRVKAGSIMRGPHPTPVVESLPSVSPLLKATEFTFPIVSETTSWSSSEYLSKLYALDSSSASMYAAYTRDPLLMTPTAEDKSVRAFYERSCGGLLIHVDNVFAMEQLSDQLGVRTSAKEGIYAGLSCLDSAVGPIGSVELPSLFLEQQFAQEDFISDCGFTDGFSENFERLTTTLTAGQQNDVLNRSIRFTRERSLCMGFVEHAQLSSVRSLWSEEEKDKSRSSRSTEDVGGKRIKCKYAGLLPAGPDKYRRESNPYMLLNDACAAAFSAIFKVSAV